MSLKALRTTRCAAASPGGCSWLRASSGLVLSATDAHHEDARVGYIVCLLPISSQDTMPERLRGLIRNQLCSHAWVRIPVVSPFFVLPPRTPMLDKNRLHAVQQSIRTRPLFVDVKPTPRDQAAQRGRCESCREAGTAHTPCLHLQGRQFAQRRRQELSRLAQVSAPALRTAMHGSQLGPTHGTTPEGPQGQARARVALALAHILTCNSCTTSPVLESISAMMPYAGICGTMVSVEGATAPSQEVDIIGVPACRWCRAAEAQSAVAAQSGRGRGRL